MNILKVLPLVFLLGGFLNAQTDCPCCDAAHKQFDFWVGNWAVSDTLGNTVGENRISKIEGGCIVLEKWAGTQGTTGTSMNYYDTTNTTWNQLWVDNAGNILKLKGGLDGDTMVLKGDLIESKNGTYYNQISWSPNEDKSVTQRWELFDKDHTLLRVLFVGVCRRKN